MTGRIIAVSESEDYLKTRRLFLPDLLQQVKEGRLKNLTAQKKLSNCPYFIRRLQLQNCLEGHRGRLK